MEEDRPITPLLRTDEGSQRLYMMVSVEEACHQYYPGLLTVAIIDVHDMGIRQEILYWLWDYRPQTADFCSYLGRKVGEDINLMICNFLYIVAIVVLQLSTFISYIVNCLYVISPSQPRDATCLHESVACWLSISVIFTKFDDHVSVIAISPV